MKYRSVCTYQYGTTVHLYLYLYLDLYVQCNAVAVTVAPAGKKEDFTLEVGVSTRRWSTKCNRSP